MLDGLEEGHPPGVREPGILDLFGEVISSVW
jgi:hypothetical protein